MAAPAAPLIAPASVSASVTMWLPPCKSIALLVQCSVFSSIPSTFYRDGKGVIVGRLRMIGSPVKYLQLADNRLPPGPLRRSRRHRPIGSEVAVPPEISQRHGPDQMEILYRVGTAVNDAGVSQSSSAVWAYPVTVRRRIQKLTSGAPPPSKLFVKVLDFSGVVA